MRTISLNEIKQIWRYKLTRDFNAEKEFFNLYLDSPFCTVPQCEFCIYDPVLMKNSRVIALKDRYYDKILISNINDFGDILQLRAPNAIYFGGGTSSLMTIKQMEKIFNELQKYFNFRNVKEKHFEMNPLSATNEKLKILIDWNFTNISFGVQSFNEEVLKFNGRVNVSIKRLREIFEILENAGVNYNLDIMSLIYQDNLEQDMKILREDLEIAKSLKPRSIDIYPNDKKLCVLNDSTVQREIIFAKIIEFRKIVEELIKNSDYVEVCGLIHAKVSEKNYKFNLRLDRKDCMYTINQIYNGSHPNNHPPSNTSVLALGGYGRRKIYSFTGNKKFWYNMKNTLRFPIFELMSNDLNYGSIK